MLAVTATGREAEDLASALSSLVEPSGVAVFPAWETLPHERLSPRSDTVGQRLAVLRRLAHPVKGDVAAGPLSVVVAPVRALLQPIVKGLGDLRPIRLRAGDDADLDDVVRRLVENGYHRVDMVEKRGEVAVRGGLLDVFPPTEEHPLRLEFWGDTVEEIRWFKVADQRSLEAADDGLFAPPCRELLLTAEVRERARELAVEHPALAEVLDQLAAGSPVEGMEAFAPVLGGEMDLLIDHLPARSAVFVCDPERIRGRAEELVRTSQEFLEASWINAAAGGEAPIDLGAAAFRSLEEIRDHADVLGQPWWTMAPFGTGVELDAHDSEAYRGDTAKALADIKGWLAEDKAVVLLSEGMGPAERMVELLKGVDVPARLQKYLETAPEPKVVHVTTGLIEHGFITPAWPCSPISTSWARRPPPRTCAVCPAAGATWSTRSSSRSATTSSTSSTASAATSRWSSAPSRAPPANTSSSSTPRATVSMSPPTSSTRSPGTWAVRPPRSTAWAAPTGPRPRPRPRRRSRRSPAS